MDEQANKASSKQVGIPAARLPRNQAEVDVALQLIESYSSERSKLHSQIDAAEVKLLLKKGMVMEDFKEKIDRCKEEFALKLSALEDERGTQLEELEDKNELDTRDIQARLKEIDKKLEEKRGFLAPIRKLPAELVVEVLKWHIGNEVPSRELAFVCKEWREWILNTPSLWRNIEARFVDNSCFADYLDGIERRIKLSGSVLLDVTLNTKDYSAEKSIEPFVRVAESGMERWKSLHIIRGRDQECGDFDDAFKGNLSNLRSLITDNLGQGIDIDSFLPLYKCILQSRPSIQHVRLVKIPNTLRNSAVFQNVESISAPWATIVKAHPLTNLRRLHITHINTAGSGSNFDLFPPLAECTTFDFLLKSWLRNLQLDNVRFLIISMGNEDQVENYTLHFPNLESLTFNQGGLYDIKGMLAPKLHTLKILDHRGHKGRVKESINVTSLFRDNSALVQLRPTTLDIEFLITAGATVVVLQNWPQIQHLSLRFNEFAWKKGFANGLLKKSDRLCPHLITLKMESRCAWKFEADEFASTAKKLFQDRRGGDLEWVRWKNKNEQWDSLTRDSIV